MLQVSLAQTLNRGLVFRVKGSGRFMGYSNDLNLNRGLGFKAEGIGK